MARLNREWHAEHRMPQNASADERIAWHLAHAAACACRPIPAGTLSLMAARGIPLPPDSTKQKDMK